MLALVKSRVDIIWLTHCHLLVELAAINDFKLAVVVCYPCMLVVLALGNIMRCLLTKTYKNVQNHPESVATTLNETCRVKNGIIVGVGNPDNWWTQDCPPQDCPPVGNTEVGNPDIHPITSPICWGPFFQAAYHALNNRAPGPNLPQIEKWQIIPEKLGPNLPGPNLLRSTC